MPSAIDPAVRSAPKAALAVLAQAPRPLDPDTRLFWERTWASLDKADRTTRRGDSWTRQVSDLTDALVERRIVGVSRSDEQDLFRTRLLEWHLERIQGQIEAPVEPPRAPLAWLPPEPWLAARALPAGTARSTAMLLALDHTQANDRAARIVLAEQHVLEELGGGNAIGAAQLAERIDGIEPTPERLALRGWALTQSGRAPDPGIGWRARVRAALEGPEAPAAHIASARIALSSGDDLAARVQLGAALSLASPEAAALTARLLVASGEPGRARVLTRAWIYDTAGRDLPSALWALACLAETPGSGVQRPPPPGDTPVR